MKDKKAVIIHILFPFRISLVVRINNFFSHIERYLRYYLFINMFKRFIPFAHAQSIYEIPVDFYQKCGVTILLIDLDNTLDSYRLYTPTERAVSLINNLKGANIVPVVVSNNTAKRVGQYAKSLNVEFISSARKPFSCKLKKFLKEKGVNFNESMLVGDQMMTDVLAAKGAGLRIILTEKIVKEDQFTTHFNRLLDRPIRNHLRKKGKLPDWRTIYGQM